MSDDEIEKTHFCGRRDDMNAFVASVRGEKLAPRVDPPKLDHWRPPRDGERYRTCSYCGSMHPDDLFTEIENGHELGPTDKNYKVYVGGRGKFYFQHLDSDQQQRFIDLLNAGKMKIGMPGHFYSMPFFMRRR